MNGNRPRKVWVIGAIAGALLMLLAATGAIQAAMGGAFNLFWWTIDSGGGTSTGADDLSLTGTIGQQDAEEAVSAGGEYRLAGGFWHNDANAGAELASVAVDKTVGIEPTGCATARLVDLLQPGLVYFCITIRNSGAVTLTHHLIDDAPLGIKQEVVAMLAPGGVVTLTQTEIPALAWQATSSLTNTVVVTSANFAPAAAAVAPAVVGRVTATSAMQAQVRLRIPTRDSYDEEPRSIFLPVIR